uniref:Uncharacterized protein n=1 Tax=Hemiselmis andersenii TaxID=464988 RepID=A0A7S0TT31_HEMAN
MLSTNFCYRIGEESTVSINPRIIPVKRCMESMARRYFMHRRSTEPVPLLAKHYRVYLEPEPANFQHGEDNLCSWQVENNVWISLIKSSQWETTVYLHESWWPWFPPNPRLPMWHRLGGCGGQAW